MAQPSSAVKPASAGGQVILQGPNYLKFFPELNFHFEKKCQIKSFKVQENFKVAKKGVPIKYIVCSLYAPMRASVSLSGSGQNRMIKNIEVKEFLGIYDLIVGNTRYNYDVNTAGLTRVVCISSADFIDGLQALSDKELLALQVLCRSEAVTDFCMQLASRGAPIPEVLRLTRILGPDIHRIKVGDEIAMRPGDIVFSQSGALDVVSGPASAVKIEDFCLRGGNWLRYSDVSRYCEGENVVRLRARSDVSYQIFNSESFYRKISETTIDLVEALSGSEDIVVHQTRMQTANLIGKSLDVKKLKSYGVVAEGEKLLTVGDPKEQDKAFFNNLSVFLATDGKKHKEIKADGLGDLNRTLVSCAKVLEKNGFMTNLKFYTDKSGDRIKLPCIVKLKDRFQILLYAKGSTFLVHDPVQGLMKLKKKWLFDNWERQVLELDLSVIDAESDYAKLVGKEGRYGSIYKNVIKTMASEYRGFFINLAAISILQSLLVAFYPMVLHKMIDEVIIHKEIMFIQIYVAAIVFIVVFNSIGNYAAKHIQEDVEEIMYLKAGSEFYRTFFRLPIGFFSKGAFGEVITKLRMIGFSVHSYFQVRSRKVLILSKIILFTIILFFYSLKIGLVTLLLLPIVYFVAKFINESYLGEVSGRHGLRVEFHRSLTEILKGFQSLTLAGVTEHKIQQSEKVYMNFLRTEFKNHLRRYRLDSGIRFVSAFAFPVLVYLTLTEIMQGELSRGSYVAITIYFTMLLSPIIELAVILSNKQIADASDMFFNKVMAATEGTEELAVKSKIVELRGRIRFENVNFKFSKRESLVLKDLSFTIEPGQSVAIVGRSGSGKSTLGRLIAGQLEPTSGSIYYDEIDARVFEKEFIRSQICLINQVPSLFSGSLKSNVAYNDEVCDKEKVIGALKLAGGDALLSKLKGGVDSILTARNTVLTNSEIQQISLARSFYLNPNIFVFDEGTSFLDASYERMVFQGIKDNANRNTFINIAHHLSTVKTADLILVLKDGQLVEVGSHNDLINSNGEYSELFRRQTGID